MDLNFQNREVSCLSHALREIQNSEQTQEIKLTEGMPDVGRIVSAWGQPILRGKEWGADTLNYTGGMMVWVLYAPEDAEGITLRSDAPVKVSAEKYDLEVNENWRVAK